MSPRATDGPKVHWIHARTGIPGVFVAWCGHRVWLHGPAYRDRRPTGIWEPELRPSLLTCRKCRRNLPIIVRLERDASGRRVPRLAAPGPAKEP